MDAYEKRIKELESANQPLFHGFHGFLIEKKVGKKVASEHIDRLEFFANVFLIDYQDESLAEGYDEVSGFLGDWFIRKVMWSDEASLAANIETFRMFYDYLRSSGQIDATRHAELRALIDNSEGDWFRYLRRYNDPSIKPEDVWDPDAPDSPDEEAPARSHFVLMLSGLAARYFKVRTNTLPKVDQLDAQGHWSNCWRCDVIAEHAASKTVYFLLTNARTLFSLVVPVADQKIESLVSVLSQLLAREVARIKPEIKLPTTGTFGLVRGQPRSLIGSQNELTRFALELFHSPDPSLDRLCRTLNRIPMTAIEEVFPEDAFKKCLAADPPPAAAPGNSVIPFPRQSSN